MNPPATISLELSSQILTVGPDHRNHRGGLEAVIEIYCKYFEQFNFIRSHKVGSYLYRFYIFITGITKLVGTLLFNPKIRIVHVHGSSYGSFYRKCIVILIAKYIFRKKIIYHIHGSEYHLFYSRSDRITRNSVRFIIENCECIICLSEVWKQFLQDNFSARKVEILPNIIDYPCIIENNSNGTPVSFLFLGYIGKRKGIFDLLSVIIKNKDRYRNRIKLYIGGNGETKRLESLIIREQLEGIVEYLGWITRQEKISALNKADVYILPSFNEGLPVSILEAMSYGKAIISTPVGGIPEVVKNKKNGLIVEPGDPVQIEQAIDYFLEQPELIKTYGSVSKELVQKHLPDAVSSKLTAIYNSLLGGQ